MPNRVIRESILTSYRVNRLSERSEVFYRRLHSIVDDFGRYSANPAQLRAGCFALCLDRYTEVEVSAMLMDCITAELVETYEVAGASFLEVLRFDQRTRIMRSKWPLRVDETIVIEEGDKGGKCYKIRRLSNDGQMTVAPKTTPEMPKMTVIRPSNDGLNPNPNPKPTQSEGGEVARQMTVIRPSEGVPVFEPVKLGLWPREYDAMIADAQKAIMAIRNKPENYAKDLTKAAEDLISYLDTEKPENWQARIKEIYERPDCYERKNLKPKQSAALDAWKARVEEIKRAKAGIKN